MTDQQGRIVSAEEAQDALDVWNAGYPVAVQSSTPYADLAFTVVQLSKANAEQAGRLRAVEHEREEAYDTLAQQAEQIAAIREAWSQHCDAVYGSGRHPTDSVMARVRGVEAP